MPDDDGQRPPNDSGTRASPADAELPSEDATNAPASQEPTSTLSVESPSSTVTPETSPSDGSYSSSANDSGNVPAPESSSSIGTAPFGPMTPERRKAIREELLRKQREAAARSATFIANVHTTSDPSLSATAPPGTVTSSLPETLPPSSSVAADAAPPATLREDFIQSATDFLSSPTVKPSPLSRQMEFLRKKGLTSEEISVAMTRAGVEGTVDGVASDSAATSLRGIVSKQPATTEPPAAPPQLAAQHQPHPAYSQQLLQPYYPQLASMYPGQPPYGAPYVSARLSSVMPKPNSIINLFKGPDGWKNVVLAIIFGGGMVTAILVAVKNYISASLKAFQARYVKYLDHRQQQLINYLQRVTGLLELFSLPPPPTVTDDETEDTITMSKSTLPSVLKSSISTLDEKLRQLTATAQVYKSKLASQFEPPLADSTVGEEPISDLKQLKKLAMETNHIVTQETYMNNSYPYNNYCATAASDSSTAQGRLVAKISDVKADIRSLKGMLLNRRNFPMPSSSYNSCSSSFATATNNGGETTGSVNPRSAVPSLPTSTQVNGLGSDGSHDATSHVGANRSGMNEVTPETTEADV
ncbi:hypothetical protein SeMB42_g02978 [Synchytrium endobioticum]|uniref:Peroxisomal membrane protein PEX14 n=1 Tax=Synchytrium endobioticum TaxID=286115 RepID=A0A507DDV0_9FUNG|nr:hypothetical protein SeMB42_g02978 [Synchytrium endobioticum]TPX49040.1 hypothetical protein SeLEV6574_g01710 [Synchytrium endobioticum]